MAFVTHSGLTDALDLDQQDSVFVALTMHATLLALKLQDVTLILTRNSQTVLHVSRTQIVRLGYHAVRLRLAQTKGNVYVAHVMSTVAIALKQPITHAAVLQIHPFASVVGTGWDALMGQSLISVITMLLPPRFNEVT